ncbi:hypothetical protein CW751_02555 [Brumimicrobium salinarum]|uniref:Uncharacterized protein n=1 Tax=Brumimicrobium salinarum TaxID=2058658 RepID=A0A2I0R6L8_9FLAO|nr:hypothetical protein [Brumimicrobium salinarum]PKR82232.1 hypothetical protein CW751_02555 [Brumimicrobium salinarum]
MDKDKISQKWKKYESLVLIAVLVIFYLVGIIGLTSAYRESFLPLSFMNLLISFVVLLFALKKRALHFSFS